MSGIISTKERMLETLVTQEGRRQLAQGGLQISFVTFTDADAFYEADVTSGSSDPSARVTLEPASLPQDSITFEADDSGKLVPFRGSSLGVIDGKVLSGTSGEFLSIVTGSQFASVAGTLLSSSVDNFGKLMALRTSDRFFDVDEAFSLGTDAVSFSFNDDRPIPRRGQQEVSINALESLMFDDRLSRSPNFMHLPPVNASVAGAPPTPLGDYPSLGQRRDAMGFADLVSQLKGREYADVDFVQTSRLSNVFGQFFEVRQDRLLKLDAIDFGEFVTDDVGRAHKHVFFVGKVFQDDFGADTFVNLFTLVFD